MMLDREVWICLSGENVSYWISKGYVIPKYFNKRKNKWLIKRGTKILVKVEDLPKRSHVKILCKCDNPNCSHPIRKINYDQYSDLCTHCCKKTDEARKKYSESHLGLFSGEKNPNFGKHASEETRRKLSISHIGIQAKEKHPNWNSTLTNEERLFGKHREILPGYSLWLKTVHSKGKCEICNDTKNLRAHHLNCWEDFSNERTDVNNGACLCDKHHKEFHKLFGHRHTTKEMFEEFKKNKLLQEQLTIG